MNGGRLSDDEAMVQGMALLRAQMASLGAGAEPPAQALRMIAMRYPEEAERIEAAWRQGQATTVTAVLGEVEKQFAEDSAE
jgi:hypothetical protein